MNPTATASRRTAETRAAEARAAGEARTRRFDDTLRAARRAAAGTAGEDHAPAAPLARRKLADHEDLGLADRRDAFRGDDRADAQRAVLPAQATPAPRPLEPAAAAADLRALVRTLPVAVEAARVREGAALSLELGAALSVELRRAPDGLELVLRPDAAVSRAAAAELPAVVGALRARGLAVARAEVRARPSARLPAQVPPRVDGSPGVG